MSDIERGSFKKGFLMLFWFFWGLNIVFSVIFGLGKPITFIFLLSNILTIIWFFLKHFKRSLSINAIKKNLSILTRYYSVVYAFAGSLCLELSLPLTFLVFISVVVLGIVANYVCKLIDTKTHNKKISNRGISILCIVVCLALYFLLEIFDFKEIFVKKYLLLLLSFGLACIKKD